MFLLKILYFPFSNIPCLREKPSLYQQVMSGYKEEAGRF